MKHQKFNRYEKKENRRDFIQNAMSGSGLYIYQNSSPHAELKLPRPTKSGLREIGPSGKFQGDDYYMQLVKTGLCRLVEVLQTPEQEKACMVQEKLILEQPDCVTNAGTIEHVVDRGAKKPLTEVKAQGQQQPVLLNEAPVSDDGFVIVGEEN